MTDLNYSVPRSTVDNPLRDKVEKSRRANLSELTDAHAFFLFTKYLFLIEKLKAIAGSEVPIHQLSFLHSMFWLCLSEKSIDRQSFARLYSSYLLYLGKFDPLEKGIYKSLKARKLEYLKIVGEIRLLHKSISHETFEKLLDYFYGSFKKMVIQLNELYHLLDWPLFRDFERRGIEARYRRAVFKYNYDAENNGYEAVEDPFYDVYVNDKSRLLKGYFNTSDF